MEETKKISPIVIFGIILGASIVVSTLVAGGFFYKIKSFDNALSVTGSAKKSVTSDSVKWSSQITRVAKVSALKSGYDQMATDIVAVKEFLKQNGIEENQVQITPVFMNEIYNQYATAESKQYTLVQNIEIQSPDVQKITAISKSTGPLIDKGVVFSTTGLEYYVSTLPQMRVELLSDALKDAKDRADKLATSTGRTVGSLKSASSGVVQVLSANSTDVSDYGSYDTSKIEKDVMVTVKASFTVN
jgi:hypothetical protein